MTFPTPSPGRIVLAASNPKIFYFRSGTKAEPIVGGANFNKGGPGKNLESSVHVKGEAAGQLLSERTSLLAFSRVNTRVCGFDS